MLCFIYFAFEISEQTEAIFSSVSLVRIFEVKASLTLTHIIHSLCFDHIIIQLDYRNYELFTSRDSLNRIKQLLDYETAHSTVRTFVFIYHIYFTIAVRRKASLLFLSFPFAIKRAKMALVFDHCFSTADLALQTPTITK